MVRSHLFEVGEVGSVVEMGFAQYFGEYWSATEDDSNYELSFCSHMAYMISCNRDNGLSVRLVKDL